MERKFPEEATPPVMIGPPFQGHQNPTSFKHPPAACGRGGEGGLPGLSAQLENSEAQAAVRSLTSLSPFREVSGKAELQLRH